MWIRILAVGIIGLGGMGAVAALGKNYVSAALTTATYPVAETSGKGDRLPLIAEPQTTGAAVVNGPAEAHEVAAITIDASSATTTAPTAPVQVAVTPRPSEQRKEPLKIVSRHWHDPADTKYQLAKRKAAAEISSPPGRADTPQQASEKKNCSQSGLDTFLRSINLKSRCAT
ncbi:hypothetical protein ACE103_16180 [Bradyrhizobium sp. ma5]|uniref:hypothetical protein n=1 Tax=Bradyrhizobium sp. ma5 TaxID=3344828 RepID=UPI0035D47A6A